MKRWKKMLIMLLVICMLITTALASTIMALPADRVMEFGESFIYFDENGKEYVGWLQDGEDWYYFLPYANYLGKGTINSK